MNDKDIIPHSKVVLDEDDISGVVEVLNSGHVSQGERVSGLERELAAFVGVRHGAAVSSGTAALHLALLSLGIGEDAEVIIPSYVCTALLNAVHYVGATPIIVDIDPLTYDLSVEKAKKAATRKTKAVIVPHMFGLPADIEAVVDLGVPVIEDCAHSIGTRFGGRPVGSFGVLSIFSFYATKMLGIGEGGAVLSDDPDLMERIRDLRQYDEGDAYRVRYNYKLSDMQASLGLTRLRKLPNQIEKRQRIAHIYHGALEGTVAGIPEAPDDREHGYYRYVIRIENPEGFMTEMEKRGISCRRPVFKPLHAYLGLTGYGGSEEAWAGAVSIPIYPSLTEEEAGRVLDSIREVL